MPDIFDEFLDELKRRQAAQAGRRPGDADPDPDGGGEPPDEVPPPRRPRPIRVASTSGGGLGGRVAWTIAGVIAIVVVLLTTGVGFWTDVLWYRSVGFEPVLWTRLTSQAGLFLGVGALVLVVLLANLWIARRLAPPPDPEAAGGLRDFLERLNNAGQPVDSGPGVLFPGGPGGRGPRPIEPEPIEAPDLAPLATVALVAVAIVAAVGIGGSASGAWETVQLWIHRVPFAASGAPVTDPVFGQDISFFLFELPFLREVQSIFNGVVVVALLVAFGRYLAGAPRSGLRFPTPVRAHLAILGGLFLLSVAFGYQLDKFELVYSDRGIATGVSYTDFHAQFVAYDVLTAFSGLAAALLVGAAFTRWNWPLAATMGAWFLASIAIGRIYPEVIQRFVVAPNQLAQEAPFIANNIAMTRLAFNIDGWQEQRYGGDATLTRAAIANEAATFQNARLWDYRPLGTTLDQLQTVRSYYDFVDVDTDRYLIDGDLRQVMLSARELDVSANPNASGWVNQRVIYTHGIGLTMVPVNEVTTEGQPVLFIKNLPPVSSNGAPTVVEPRIYFGEKPTGYVIVRASQPEFDYPQSTGDLAAGGDTGTQTRWTGTTGIAMDTTLQRLLFAIRFGDLDLLISDQVRADSQLLMYRSLGARLELLAPFLRYDKDPYLVVDGRGHLVYVQDAYTTTARFPNAQGFDPGSLPETALGGAPFNYIRNSVKVVMDAYDGSMSFYVSDPDDPIIRAYAGIFPTLLKPLSDLGPDLRAHVRVPEELFNVQTRMYGSYHVTDTETFFRKDDLWTVPAGQTNEQSLPTEAYYVVMRIPGEAQPEFLLLQPMVPNSRPNMIAWVAARMDEPNYGDVRVFRFPSDTTIFGPAQIEARIDQDPTISAQITLWNQSGSRVIRGNLIVVPVGDALIYLQPVYLQSESSKFPEFQRIVVASPTRIVWANTLKGALDQLLEGGGPGPTPTPGPSTGPGPTPGPSADPGLPSEVAALIQYANDHFAAAQEALRNGDFARYGQEIELVRQALAKLTALSGASPSPAP